MGMSRYGHAGCRSAKDSGFSGVSSGSVPSNGNSASIGRTEIKNG